MPRSGEGIKTSTFVLLSLRGSVALRFTPALDEAGILMRGRTASASARHRLCVGERYQELNLCLPEPR